MIKRLFDISAALIALICLLPIILVTAIIVRLKLGKGVLFVQERPGLNGRSIMLFKFRTMRDIVDEFGKPLPDELRLTEFGKILRSTSLDELPSLLNVLKGDLSIVGPRPLLVEYLPLYNNEQAKRHDVRPGITGWAQVNGRNAISWEEKFKLDVWYVKNKSFILDIRIILLTIKKVFIRKDINASNNATMPKFTGSEIDE